MEKISSKKRNNYCTLYPEGNWYWCCYDHDAKCTLAQELQSSEIRKQADQELYRCVKDKGHPVHAAIMFLGVRTYAILKGGY